MTFTLAIRYLLGGILYPFAVHLYFGMILQPKYTKRPFWVYAAIITLILQPPCIGRMFIDNVVVFEAVGWLQIAILLGSIIIVFQNKLWEKLLILLVWMIVATISESIARIGTKRMAADFTETDPTIIIYEIVLYIIIFSILGIVGIAWKIVKTKRMPKNIWIFLLFPISQYLMVMNLPVDMAFEGAEYSDPWRVVFSLLLGIVADVILFYVMFTQSEKEEIRQRLAETEKLMDMEKGYYEAIEAQWEEMSKIRHDFANQLTAALHIAQNEQQDISVEMIGQLKEEIEKNTKRKWCENTVVNAVLAEKSRMCERAGVALEIDAEVAEKVDIQPLHLCSIIANLLDNAIFAAGESGQEKAFISVHVKQQERYLFIKVENTSKEPVKKDKRPGHGYGLQIVNNIAERYNGTYKGSWENGVYTAVVALEF